MIELSGREIVGSSRITERQASEFKALVAAVENCGDAKVRLNLTDLDATSLWKRESDYYKFVSKPNLTVIVDPETAATLRSYMQVTNAKINFEVHTLDVVPEEEDPRIEAFGSEYATKAVYKDVVSLPNGGIVRDCLYFKVSDCGRDILSSIGISGESVRRAIELIAKKASAESKRFVIDFEGIEFEGGCDYALADALVTARRLYKGLVVRVLGEYSGISEYTTVFGRVKLSAASKVRFFSMLRPNTVLRLSTYPSIARADIAGRKGSGTVAGVVLVIYRGIDGEDILFDEIPTQQLYLPEDLELICEVEQVGDKRIPRRRNLGELGIVGLCSGAHGHLGPVDKKITYSVSDGAGNLMSMSEPEFVARGLDSLGFVYDEELLELCRVLPPAK